MNNPHIEIEKLRAALIENALPHIVFEGWSSVAFEHAATDMEVAKTEFLRAFPGGTAEAFAWHSAARDRQMVEKLAQMDINEMRIRDRISTAVRCRIELEAANREAVRRSLSFLAKPQNATLGLSCLYRTVDAIWRVAGDTATDYNFYTKRLLLAGVISTTTLYWLDDDTDDFSASWAFLDRRIADVMKVPVITGRLKEAAARLPRPEAFFRRFAR
jgi:ubiquinone biosynthesis protein COQ9